MSQPPLREVSRNGGNKKKSTLGEAEGADCPGDDLLSRLSTIIGEACLTTVFGMGTGMARSPCSPGILMDSQLAMPACRDQSKVNRLV